MEGVKTDSRKLGRLGFLLALVGMAIMMVLELGLSAIFNEIGIGGILWLLFLAFIFLFPGLALLGIDRATRRWAGSEALGFFVKTVIVSLGLILAGFFVLLDVIMQPLVEQRGVLFILFGGLIFGGLAVLFAGQIIFAMRRGRTRLPVGLGAMGSLRNINPEKTFQTVVESLRETNPEKTFQTRNFTVMKKSDVYILLPRMSNAAYFVKLFDQTPVQEKAVRLPMLFFQKTPFNVVAGLRVAKFRGEITIPIDVVKRGNKTTEKYVKGTGIQYVVPLYDMNERRDLSDQFTRTGILNIISEISNESG
jgi:hypothetical protein